MSYVLIQWDDSRSGQSDEWALHLESDGTELKSWGDDPRRDPNKQKEMREAIATDDLLSDSNLPSAARQARAMAVASEGIKLGGDAFIRESSDTPLPW